MPTNTDKRRSFEDLTAQVLGAIRNLKQSDARSTIPASSQILPEQQLHRRQLADSALGSLRLEGLPTHSKAKALADRYVQGEISTKNLNHAARQG